ncbi:MAG: hypothetical protein ACLUD2_16630 [Clostridium sp.]
MGHENRSHRSDAADLDELYARMMDPGVNTDGRGLMRSRDQCRISGCGR